MALFYQLVVNDWWILMEAVVYRVGQPARIFFVAFYSVSVLIVFSVRANTHCCEANATELGTRC